MCDDETYWGSETGFLKWLVWVIDVVQLVLQMIWCKETMTETNVA